MKFIFFIPLLFLLSCAESSQKCEVREPRTYQVFKFENQFRRSSVFEKTNKLNIEADSLIRFSDSLAHWTDSIVDIKVDSLMEFLDFNRVLDSVNHIYGITNSLEGNYNFEVDLKGNYIHFYKRGKEHETFYFDSIRPLGGARMFIVDELESFIFYGNVDSISALVDGKKIYTYK